METSDRKQAEKGLKRPKRSKNEAKKRSSAVWDHDAARSSRVTPTRKRTCNAGPFSTLFAFGESYCYAVIFGLRRVILRCAQL